MLIGRVLIAVICCALLSWAQPGWTQTSSDAGRAKAASQGKTIDRASKADSTTVAPASEGATDKTRVNNLANLEALLNIIANGGEILGLLAGIPMCLAVPVGLVFVFQKGRRFLGSLFIVTGPAVCIVALAIPGIINWLVASARDANLFN